jgi:hypothetical protein
VPPTFDASSFTPPRPRGKIVDQPNGPAAAAQQTTAQSPSTPATK